MQTLIRISVSKSVNTVDTLHATACRRSDAVRLESPFVAIWACGRARGRRLRCSTAILSCDPLRTMQTLGGHLVDTCS